MPDMERLYQEYARQVYKYIFSLCHHEQTAEELVQENFLLLIGLFAVGFSVSSQDMDMTYEVKDNHLEIHFQLKNGHDLIGSVKPEIIYDENRKVIGMEQRYRPVWVFNNPFDDVGSTFTLGSELPGLDSQDGLITNTVTIEFADKTVQFINGRLVE